MKTHPLLPVAVFAATASLAGAQGFFVEAGAGLATFDGGDYSLSSILPPDPATNTNTVAVNFTDPTFRDDDTAAVVRMAAGYRFADWFSARIGYQHFGRTSATSSADVVIAANDVDAGSITMTYSDEVQVVSFAPELRWQAVPRLTLSVSPQVNWIFSDASLRTESDSALVLVIPLIERSTDELTLGATLGAEWAATDRLRVTARYDYMDLDVSWGRDAHVFTAGLRLEF